MLVWAGFPVDGAPREDTVHKRVFNSGFERIWKLGQWHLSVEEGVGGGKWLVEKVV